MTQTPQLLSCEDESKIADFLDHYIGQAFSVPASPVYHYTTGESFIKIIQSGELWSTQAACLNDTTELTHATEEIRKRVNAKLCGSHNPAIKPVLTWISDALSSPGPEVSPVFVTCFSEQRDSLSQWRAYSGGEGGYAIQFDPAKLYEATFASMPDGTLQPQMSLVRVEYEPCNHATMFDDMLKWTEKFFLELEGSTKVPLSTWTEQFCEYWLLRLLSFAPLIKNKSFQDEKECRLIYHRRPEDQRCIRFLQRQSMMSRHLPLRLKKPLPITEVLVGPCRHPRLSQIAVEELLLTNGFDMSVISVQTTEVPYRTT